MCLPRSFIIAVTMTLACCCTGRGQSSDAKTEQARQFVQEALRAEISGQASEREELLRKAGEASPKEVSTRWLNGEVLVGKEWRSYESIVARAQKSKQLEQYRQLRDESQPTIASQYALAIFCRKHGLRDREMAHWSAILELDADHAEARQALGFVRAGNQWRDPKQVEVDQRSLQAVSEVFRKDGDNLQKIADKLASGQMSRAEATEFLRNHASVHAIPVWEHFLSSAHAEGSAAVVDALSSLDMPEASLALARHALWSTDPSVRETACQLLKHRDFNAFIPAILNQLQGPWLAFRNTASDGSTRLVNRYALVADGKDKITLHVLDDSFIMRGNLAAASQIVTGTVQQTQSEQEMVRQQMNAQVQRRNQAVSSLLRTITGETELESPQDWWQWWDTRNEVYATGLKPVESSYAFRNREAVAALPLTASNSDVSSQRVAESRKKDCLAGGTPVLTERGLVAIERVRMGDMVLAKHPVTGELRLQPVTQTTMRDPEPLIKITLQSEKAKSEPAIIRASGGHPFWVSGQGWQRARLLEPGMRLHCARGFATVQSVELEDKSTRTYNLVVADFHSYFVGTDAMLTHDNSVMSAVRCKVPGLVEN